MHHNDNEKREETSGDMPGGWRAAPVDYTFWKHGNISSPLNEPSPFAKAAALKAQQEMEEARAIATAAMDNPDKKEARRVDAPFNADSFKIG